MKKIVVANWKMFPNTARQAEDLFRFTSEVIKSQGNKISAVVCPPFVYLENLLKLQSDALIGAQNCHWEYRTRRSFTGEISVPMLKNLNVRYVIVGHSERRWLMMENDKMINEKIKAVLKNDLIPILCVGERTKKENPGQIVKNQIKLNLAGLDGASRKNVIIAYEPAWAIGQGKADDPDRAGGIIKAIKRILPSSPVLYGGSIDSMNIADFVSKKEIEGVMVGGASADKIEIQKIIEISSKFSG